VKEAKREELSTFVVHKFKLNIVSEITKFFLPAFAWKIQLQILFFFAKQMEGSLRVSACEGEVWDNRELMIKDIV
jgi:hypothetical protein